MAMRYTDADIYGDHEEVIASSKAFIAGHEATMAGYKVAIADYETYERWLVAHRAHMPVEMANLRGDFPPIQPEYGRISVIDEEGERTDINEVELVKIQSRFPHIRHAFTCHDKLWSTDARDILNRATLILRDVSDRAGFAFKQYIELGDVNYRAGEVDGDNQPCSLLLHLHVLKLALAYDLDELATEAKLNFTEELELSCYTSKSPIDLCEAIRYLYTLLRKHTELRENVAHYCVMAFNYHLLYASDAFSHIFFQSPAFHKDLQRANCRSDFSSDAAVQIMNMPVCKHAIHQTEEAWATGWADFTCRSHEGLLPVSRPGTPRAGQHNRLAYHIPAEESRRLTYTTSEPITPAGDLTPVPGSPATSTQGSWVDVDSEADWSDLESPARQIQKEVHRERVPMPSITYGAHANAYSSSSMALMKRESLLKEKEEVQPKNSTDTQGKKAESPNSSITQSARDQVMYEVSDSEPECESGGELDEAVQTRLVLRCVNPDETIDEEKVTDSCTNTSNQQDKMQDESEWASEYGSVNLDDNVDYKETDSGISTSNQRDEEQWEIKTETESGSECEWLDV